MRILYGVVGEGMGHALRSSVVIEKLLADGHDVHIVASGRAVPYLQQRFGGLTEIWGLTLTVVDNQVHNLLTTAANLRGALKGLPRNVREYFEVEMAFEPELVISDFETWSWLFAKVYDIPVICLDNIQIINRCKHDADIIGQERDDFRLAKGIVKARTPNADHYLITTCFYPPVRKERTTLVPPVLRQNIFDAVPTTGEHLLVYQNSESFGELEGLLHELDVPCLVYGLRRVEQDVVEKKLTFRAFSDQGFIDDLASSRGVIASAGFTLIGEAVHLGKPYLATPIRKQFEQLLNARYLAKLGYGDYSLHLDLPTLRRFLDRLPEHEAALATYERQDNSPTFEALEALFDRHHAELL